MNYSVKFTSHQEYMHIGKGSRRHACHQICSLILWLKICFILHATVNLIYNFDINNHL